MKEQIERRRELRKNRDNTILNMVKALESQGMDEEQVVQTLAIAESISKAEAQQYYEQLLTSKV